MTKPKKKIREYYDWIELKRYLKEKHNIGQDFWDWVFANLWNYDTHNGSNQVLDVEEYCDDEWLKEEEIDIPDNIKAAFKLIKEDFKEDEMEVHLCW